MKSLMKALRGADWVLLILLVLVTNQAMLAVKFAGLLLVFLLRPNVSLQLFSSRLPKFYWLIILLAILNLVLHVRDYNPSYLVEFGVGCAYWIMPLLCMHQIKCSLEKGGLQRAQYSLQVFTVVNLICTVAQYIRIAVITHRLNPFKGLNFPYGMSTGDKMWGVFFEASYCNMMVSALLVFYFLYRRQYGFMALAAVSMLSVFGNAGILGFLAVLIGCVITTLLVRHISMLLHFRSVALPSGSRRGLVLLVLLVGLFYTLISPYNGVYVWMKGRAMLESVMQHNADSSNVGRQKNVAQLVQSTSGASTAIKDIAGWDYRHYDYPVRPTDSMELASRMATTMEYCNNLKGKGLSYVETRRYLRSSTGSLLLGAGPGRFSSLLAERFSGLDTGRIFRKFLPRYATTLFTENHRLITVIRMNGSEAGLSNANWPQSFYNQLPGEYGLAGCLLFALFYIGYFVRRVRSSTYSLWLGLLMIPFATLSYLFEHLCVIIFLELLLLLDVRSPSAEASTI